MVVTVLTEDTLRECLSRVKARLHTKLGDDVFDSWFTSLDVENTHSKDPTIVHLSVPSEFLRNWIVSHYKTILFELWKAELPATVKIFVSARSYVRRSVSVAVLGVPDKRKQTGRSLSFQDEITLISDRIAESSTKGVVQKRAPFKLLIKDILRVVCAFYGVEERIVTSSDRRRAITYVRRVVIHLALHLTSRSLPEIGTALGDKDHTTVMYNRKKILESLQSNLILRDEVEELAAAFTNIGLPWSPREKRVSLAQRSS